MSQLSKIPALINLKLKRKEFSSVATQTGSSLNNSLSSEELEFSNHIHNLMDLHLSSTPTAHKRRLSKSSKKQVSDDDQNMNDSIEKKKRHSDQNNSINSISLSPAELFSKSIRLNSPDQTLLNFLENLDLSEKNDNKNENISSFEQNDQNISNKEYESQIPTTSRKSNKLIKSKKKRKSHKRYSKKIPKEIYNNYNEDSTYFSLFDLKTKENMLQIICEKIDSIDNLPPNESNSMVRRSQRLQLKTLEKLKKQKMTLNYLIRMDRQQIDYDALQDEIMDVNLEYVTDRNLRNKNIRTRAVEI